jgi:sterol desaturase/sphingolipid hydroxylase (fatty acid hydroxylase superfamily)
MKSRKRSGWLTGLLTVGTFGVLLWMEHRRPLRRTVESKLRRNVRNLAVAVIGAVSLRIAESPIVGPVTAFVEQRRWGILKLKTLPTWVEVTLAVMLMDYTLYWWHVFAHRVPWLWRLHLPHHVDLDLDASTALRFHFAELMASVPFRIGQVLLIGVSPLSFSVWETFLLLSIMFHHANVELPVETEKWLNRIIVTPRMHGIHHSIVRAEAFSNWSGGLTVWDWVHGTLKLNVPQQSITIGVPAYLDPEDVILPKIIKLPFEEQRPSWLLPGDGEPMRPSLPAAHDHLLA